MGKLIVGLFRPLAICLLYFADYIDRKIIHRHPKSSKKLGPVNSKPSIVDYGKLTDVPLESGNLQPKSLKRPYPSTSQLDTQNIRSRGKISHGKELDPKPNLKTQSRLDALTGTIDQL
jgi:hypothetical protein